MRTVMVSLLCLTVQCHALRAEDCTRELLKTYTDPPGDLVTVSGERFRVLGEDFIDPNEWLPNQKLMVCKDIPQSRKFNEKLYQIKNLDRGETLEVSKLDIRADCIGGPTNPACKTPPSTR